MVMRTYFIFIRKRSINQRKNRATFLEGTRDTQKSGKSAPEQTPDLKHIIGRVTVS